MKLSAFFRYASQNLRRGGQRVLIAVLAIAFGVMSLVAMSTLSKDIMRVMLYDLREGIGGDAQLYQGAGSLPAGALAEIEALQAAGRIARYVPVADGGELLLKTPASGRVTFLQNGIGIDPQVYPLLGELSLSAPEGASVADVLQAPGDVVVTQDVARDRELAIGDVLLIGSQLGGAPVEMRVAGIADRTPSYKGNRLYYDFDTARLLAGQPEVVTDVYLLWGDDPAGTRAALEQGGWQIYAPEALNEAESKTRDVFDFMLKGAGIMGLIVGGIGIANTMQVLLARRKDEVALLKTLGFSQGELASLFCIETALIGLLGSALGVALATLLSWWLLSQAGQFITLMLSWHFDPLISLAGFGIGIVTTLLFSAHAIWRASQVRPAVLFRDQPTTRGSGRLRTVGFYVLVAIPFVLLTSFVMGSLIEGVGILLLALAGLIGLGLLLGGSTWLSLRLMPTFGFNLLRMARNNMRRRGAGLVYAMIALFIGVYTLGFAITVISVSKQEYDVRAFSQEGYNLIVLADAEQEDDIRPVLDEQPLDSINVRYQAPLAAVAVDASNQQSLQPLLQGRDGQLWDVSVTGAPWGSESQGVYLPARLDVPAGATVQVTTTDGQQRALPVVGSYSPISWDHGLVMQANGILVGRELLQELAGEQVKLTVAAMARPAELDLLSDTVGQALPGTTVLTSLDVDRFVAAALKSLFAFAVTMAGLALAAGAVLVANSVSLAMMERRFEIGVLKAMGYSQGRVLLTVALEYGLVAAIVSVGALLGVEGTILVLQYVDRAVGEILHVEPAIGLLIVLVGAGLTLFTALAVAWRPTRLRPLVVLNAHN